MFMVENPPNPVSNAAAATSNQLASQDVVVAREPKPTAEGNIRLTTTINAEADVMCCRFDEEGGLLAAGLVNGIIKVYSTDTGNCVYSLSDQETLSGHLPVTCLHWKPAVEDQNYGNVLLATYADGKVKHWHVSSSMCLSTVTESRQVLACAFNRSVSRFVTAGSDPKLYVYDEKTKQVLHTLGPSSSNLIMDGHMMRVFTTQFIPGDDNVFVTAGWDDTMQFWDTRVDSKHCVRKIFGPHVCGDALDIMPGNHNILTGSWRPDNALQIWDYGSGKLIKNIPADYSRSLLYCVQWQGGDGILAGGSDENMMRCVDSTTEQTTGRLIDLPRAVYSLDHNSRTRHPVIAVGCSNHVYMLKKH